MIEKKYPIPDRLKENASIHCASLVVVEDVSIDSNLRPKFAVPSESFRNGTLTLVKSEDRIFGITCWHVIDHYRTQKLQAKKSFSLRTMVNGFPIVVDRFIQPKVQFGESPVDIAIRELSPSLVQAIGKAPIDLDICSPMPLSIEHGYAVGFPEFLKKKTEITRTGYRISMPQVEILAELPGPPTRRFMINGEMKSRPKYCDYSGMSGGPIFWTTVDEYGIMGIVYEGGVGNALADGKNVSVYGELATPSVIKDWIKQVPPLTAS